MSRFAVLEAPSILGLRPTGVECLPEALLQAGLLERLRARHAGRVVPETPYDAARDPATLTLNANGIASYSLALADAVGGVLDRGEFPVVLGGDCSILLGNLLALKRRGRFGLLFIDGHADFYNPEANPNGEAASMDLALATGRGPDVVTNIEGRRPWSTMKMSWCSATGMQRSRPRTAVNRFPCRCWRWICPGFAVAVSRPLPTTPSRI